MLHHVLGAALRPDVVDDEQVVSEDALKGGLPLLEGRLHGGGDGADVGLQRREAVVDDAVGDGSGHERFARADASVQDESVAVVLREGVGVALAGGRYLRVSAVVRLEGACPQEVG